MTFATMKVLREKLFSAFSVPSVIISDNMKCFASKTEQICFRLSYKHDTTTPHYPQPSHVKWFNHNLHSALTVFPNDSPALSDGKLYVAAVKV
jgi:hypothetical protein